MRGSMPRAQPIRPSTTIVPIPSPPPPIGKPKPPPPKPPPGSPRRSSILSLCSVSSKRIAALHRPDFLPRPNPSSRYSANSAGWSGHTRHSTNLALPEPFNGIGYGDAKFPPPVQRIPSRRGGRATHIEVAALRLRGKYIELTSFRLRGKGERRGACHSTA